MLLKVCACEVSSYCIEVATATNDIGQGTYDMIGLMIYFPRLLVLVHKEEPEKFSKISFVL